MQRFLRDLEETISWMDEKSASLAAQDPTLGSSSASPRTRASQGAQQQDLTQVASLQRKHDAFERSLSTLGEKVEALEREGARLTSLPANASSVPVVNERLDELQRKWTELVANTEAHKRRLEILRKLYQFLADSMELLAWYDEIGVVLGQNDDHVRDIESVEMLIERNRQYKKCAHCCSSIKLS